MTDATSAQIIKLARTLGVSADQLDYLTDVPAADVRDFRFQVADLLFDSQSGGLRKVAAAAKVIPAPVIAKLVARSRNALLAARMAGVLEPAHAVDVAKRLPVDFLAEVAPLLDPRRAAYLIAGVPTETIVEVGKLLARQEDWITLGDLMAVVSDESVRAAQAVLDGAALLHSAFLIDDAEHLERLVGLVSERKLAEMLEAAAEHDLWDEYRSTLGSLSDSALTVVRAAVDQLPPEHRDRALAEIADRRPAS
ncbi:hypothetical protein ACFYO1_35635 [Nocardia sp. NPDC006044]|uniref:hypothetical protein n=1 Tax=Nocardia sp. NPDC006044 TaxID=3364306 RepID=UPI003697C5BC